MTSQSALDRISRYAPLFLWMLLIYFASTSGFSAANTSRILRPLLLWVFPHVSEETIALIHFFVRKAAHFVEYAVLGILAGRAFMRSPQRLLSKYWFLAAVLLTVSYALLDEFHQSFVLSRSSSLYDSGIDIAGGLLALIGLAYFDRLRKNPQGSTLAC